MKPEDFSKEHFLLKVPVKASIDKLFDSIATAKGLESWFLGDVVFTNDSSLAKNEFPSPTSKYHWKWQKDYETSGTVLGIEKNKHITYSFGSDFEVHFKLESLDEKNSILHLKQLNHNPKPENEFSFINCCVCWTFFLTNLKSVLENQIDLREQHVFDESFINQ